MSYYLFGFFFFEHIVCDTLFEFKDFIFHDFLVRGRESDIIDDFSFSCIKMSLLISLILIRDFFTREVEVTDIHSCQAFSLFQEIREDLLNHLVVIFFVTNFILESIVHLSIFSLFFLLSCFGLFFLLFLLIVYQSLLLFFFDVLL